MKYTLLMVFFGMLLKSTFASSSAQVFYKKEKLSLKHYSQKRIVDQVRNYAFNFLSDKGFDLSHKELKLLEKRESLSGTHYRYFITHKGFKVFNNDIIITLNSQKEVVRVFSNISNKLKFDESVVTFSKEQAMEFAWNSLRADKSLTFYPNVSLGFYEAKEKLVLTYNVSISTEVPYGHWDVFINSQDGSILKVANQVEPTKNIASSEALVENKKRLSFQEALSQLKDKRIKNDINKTLNSFKLYSGKALVFNPNPNTVLNSLTINNDSPNLEFEDAYSEEDLNNFSITSSRYSLSNSELVLEDFESPSSKVTTNTSKDWLFKRDKKNQFLDTMTFFHLDKSMNYLKDLGFKGDKKVFRKILTVDSNGAGGADNSYFSPSENALSFGHGCVADNEDADVILHELGHAIQINIVGSNWYGGDTGAMGEGFGDYWAASYSYTTKNGKNFKPDWVFKWDGHNSCWGGRVLDKVNMKYSHSKNYGAHQGVAGGVSDELWSTPIFQAFKELYDQGVERGVMDRIILESHFGIGSRMKMRDMAKIIVETAKSLYPNENYFVVYQKHFEVNEIL